MERWLLTALVLHTKGAPRRSARTGESWRGVGKRRGGAVPVQDEAVDPTRTALQRMGGSAIESVRPSLVAKNGPAAAARQREWWLLGRRG